MISLSELRAIKQEIEAIGRHPDNDWRWKAACRIAGIVVDDMISEATTTIEGEVVDYGPEETDDGC